MIILEFSNEVTTTKDGVPAIKMIKQQKTNITNDIYRWSGGKDYILEEVWLTPFSKHNFQVTRSLDMLNGVVTNSIQTGLCEAIDFVTKEKTIGYVSDSEKEFVGKTHLAGLISLTLLEYINRENVFYKMPKIKYVSGIISQQIETEVTSLCKFIDMVYDYLQKG